jgi:hypothetical protein
MERERFFDVCVCVCVRVYAWMMDGWKMYVCIRVCVYVCMYVCRLYVNGCVCVRAHV